ncbi:MAG: ATP-binding protein [Promethearchaeota archaeon]
MNMKGLEDKVGEVINAKVSFGIEVKLSKNSEEIKIGYPIMVEGNNFDYFCIIGDIYHRTSPIIESIANSLMAEDIIPATNTEGVRGKPFYSIAKLNCVQIVDKHEEDISNFETIPPFFAKARHTTQDDVNKVYHESPQSGSVGTLRGIDFHIPIDFEELTSKPFGLFGRTGSGKSILNKIICGVILKLKVANVLVFDMQSEYGWRSRADQTAGLKFFFEDRIKLVTIDKEMCKDADEELIISRSRIKPEDIIFAFPDLTQLMQDAIYHIDHKKQKGQSLIDAIENADPEDPPEKIHPGTLLGLQGRIKRLQRFTFVKNVERKDSLERIVKLITEANNSIVIDFGKFGTDLGSYMFLANILTRRLYEIYGQQTQKSRLPRLVVFLEEAHKFISPKLAGATLFDRLAREMRKFGLTLALVDQRPSQIDDEILSQLANRFILSLHNPKDIDAALTGTSDPSNWKQIVRAVEKRTTLVFGDAIKIPTVIDVEFYSDENMIKKFNVDPTSAKIKKLDKEKVKKIFD